MLHVDVRHRSSKGTTRTILKAQLAKVEGDYENFEKRNRAVLDAARRAAGPASSSPSSNSKLGAASSSSSVLASAPPAQLDAAQDQQQQATMFKEKGAASNVLDHETMIAEDTAKEMERIAKDLAELHDMVSVVQDQLHAQV